MTYTRTLIRVVGDLSALNVLVREAVDRIEGTSVVAKFRTAAARSGGRVSAATIKSYYYGDRDGDQVREETLEGLAAALDVTVSQLRRVANQEQAYLRRELLRSFGRLPTPEWQVRAVEAVRALVGEAETDRTRQRRLRGRRRDTR